MRQRGESRLVSMTSPVPRPACLCPSSPRPDRRLGRGPGGAFAVRSAEGERDPNQSSRRNAAITDEPSGSGR